MPGFTVLYKYWEDWSFVGAVFCFQLEWNNLEKGAVAWPILVLISTFRWASFVIIFPIYLKDEQTESCSPFSVMSGSEKNLSKSFRPNMATIHILFLAQRLLLNGGLPILNLPSENLMISKGDDKTKFIFQKLSGYLLSEQNISS